MFAGDDRNIRKVFVAGELVAGVDVPIWRKDLLDIVPN